MPERWQLDNSTLPINLLGKETVLIFFAENSLNSQHSRLHGDLTDDVKIESMNGIQVCKNIGD